MKINVNNQLELVVIHVHRLFLSRMAHSTQDSAILLYSINPFGFDTTVEGLWDIEKYRCRWRQ
jgi:hypothetical protein